VADFLIKTYTPALRNLTRDVHLTMFEKLGLGLRVAGTGLKLLYAFAWQEQIIKAGYLNDHEVNDIGGVAMPYVNMLCNALNGFKHSDHEVQSCKNVYPGDDTCRTGPSPHAKWHEMSANGLLDLILLADDINGMLSQKLGRGDAVSRRWPLLKALNSPWFSFWGGWSPGE